MAIRRGAQNSSSVCPRVDISKEDGYNRHMKVATSSVAPVEVGVRDLKNNLSRYLDRVANGEEVVVTEHGRPVARLTSVGPSTDKLAALVASGAVERPAMNARRRPAGRITTSGSVSELVAEQRR